MTRQSVFLVLLLASVLLSCSGQERNSSPVKKERTFKVRTVPVSFGEFFTKFRTSGYFEAVHKLRVRPEVAGRVKRILAEEGDRVKRNQLLLEVEDSLYKKAYEEALWRFRQAKRELENVEAVYLRRKRLFEKELISREEYQEVKTKLESARANLKSLRAILEKRKLELEKTKVKSPIDGLVLKRMVERGDYVTPQRDTYEIVKLKPLRFVFKVPQDLVGMLTVGTQVEINLQDRKIKAPVTYISPQADRMRLFTVKATLGEPGDVKPGTYGEVAFNYRKIRAVPVPEHAVQLSQRHSFVWVVRDSRAVRLPVRVLAHEEGKVFLEGNFREDDRIIVEGLMFLYEGAKVLEE